MALSASVKDKIPDLRRIITESLRVQRSGEAIDYVDVGMVLSDALARQNHAIFARRGCGKTLLLHYSSKMLPNEIKSVYLNCEDFKRHTFPNVLIEILQALFRTLENNQSGWFGRKRRLKEILADIIEKLENLKHQSDIRDEQIKNILTTEASESDEAAIGAKLEAKDSSIEAKISGAISHKKKEETERIFRIHKQKLQELDTWLPELKERIREFFNLSNSVRTVFIQIDDLYHLKRADQAFVVDYIHRLCKDVPIYFKIATLRHASTLYVDRDGQPIGAQERHDYQPIDIDYTFNDFNRTKNQNWQILRAFAKKAGMQPDDISGVFKGAGFARLVMAGGGVPRDVLSLFLEALNTAAATPDGRIGKDEVRILSRSNLERRIDELKQDSQGDEQSELISGIYVLRNFCLEKKSNIFLVQEKLLQQNDSFRDLFYRLMDYRIIHLTATALTHKSQPGTYRAFAIDIGCYAHLRKLQGRFTEIDVSATDAKEKMRSAPVLDDRKLSELLKSIPSDVEQALLAEG